MEFGKRLRAIRRSRDITLQQMAEATGLSRRFISQIESDVANPSVGTLKKITDALGIPLAALLVGPTDTDATLALAPPPSNPDGYVSKVQLVRRDQRKMLVWPGRQATSYLLTPDLQRKLEVILDVLDAGHASGEEWLSHKGEEFGFVLEGRYEVTIGDQVYVLEEGDAIYYPSHLPHKTRVLGDRPAKTLWVITPPTL